MMRTSLYCFTAQYQASTFRQEKFDLRYKTFSGAFLKIKRKRPKKS